jgi:hypothetical protein
MRKGLTVTLMTAAIAMWSVSAMAVAPVIFDIPSPVVSDEGDITVANEFVYVDAIDLSRWVSDPDGGPNPVVWSYDIVGTPRYNINGVGVLGAGNPVAPGSAAISTQVLGGEYDDDADADTITVRNINLSATVGAAGTDPGANDTGSGVDAHVAAETQAVTLYASDGATVSSKTIFFYTQSDGWDHLSGGGAVRDYEQSFDGTTDNWTMFTDGGTVTHDTAGSTAICLETPAVGSHAGGWAGWLGQLNLVQNNVYHIRMLMNGSNATAGSTPFWDVAVNNFTGTAGLNAYGCNYFFLDGAGGANAVLQTAMGQNFDVWWCPSPITQPDWNDTSGVDTTPGPFHGSNAANKDARLIFRTLDSNANPGITADDDFGTICIDNVTIDRVDLADMSVDAAGVYSSDMGTADQDTWSADIIASSATATFSSGELTIAPTTGGVTSMLVFLNPGDKNNDYQTPSTLADNYPVAWNDDELYQITMGVYAPDQLGEDEPCDVFWLGADTPTNELINLSFVTGASWASGMPKQGAAQDYHAFFYTNNQTQAEEELTGLPIPEFKFWRPRVMVGNNTELNFNANGGSMVITGVTVNRVSFAE